MDVQPGHMANVRATVFTELIVNCPIAQDFEKRQKRTQCESVDSLLDGKYTRGNVAFHLPCSNAS